MRALRLAAIALTAALAAASLGGVFAQSGQSTWEAPQVAWESQGKVSDPVLVTDARGAVHLFFVDRPDEASSHVLYHVAVDEAGIGNPVDVAVGVEPGYRVVADRMGRLHLAYHGPNNAYWYSMVDGSRAGEAQEWLEPQLVAQGTPGGGLTVDAAGRPQLCFPRGDGLFYTVGSSDGGDWEPEQLVGTVSSAGIASAVACAVGGEATKYVAWAESSPPNYYPPTGLYLASTTADGDWTAPEPLGGEHFTLPRLAVDADGGVHLVWQGDVSVGGRYYQYLAPDAAGVWSAVETVLPAGEGGLSGEAPIAFDGAGAVHVATAADKGIRHVTRSAGRWSEPTNLSVSLDELPNDTESIEQPALTVAMGNRLFGAWEFDFKRIYLVRGIAAAPETTPVAMTAQPRVARTESSPTTEPTTLAAARATSETSSIEGTKIPTFEELPPAQSGGNYLLLGLSMLMASIVVLGVVVMVRRK